MKLSAPMVKALVELFNQRGSAVLTDFRKGTVQGLVARELIMPTPDKSAQLTTVGLTWLVDNRHAIVFEHANGDLWDGYWFGASTIPYTTDEVRNVLSGLEMDAYVLEWVGVNDNPRGRVRDLLEAQTQAEQHAGLFDYVAQEIDIADQFVVVPDDSNNVGRRCNRKFAVPSDLEPREWVVVAVVKDTLTRRRDNLLYVLRHVGSIPREYPLALSETQNVTNLY
jgi:hypothetical protein